MKKYSFLIFLLIINAKAMEQSFDIQIPDVEMEDSVFLELKEKMNALLLIVKHENVLGREQYSGMGLNYEIYANNRLVTQKKKAMLTIQNPFRKVFLYDEEAEAIFGDLEAKYQLQQINLSNN